MVNTRDPNKVIDTFQAEIARSLQDWRDLQVKVNERGPLAQRVSMDAFTRVAVAFEGFRSDWHLAAITKRVSPMTWWTFGEAA
ncbi:hypothetical protein [Rhodococcus sp. 1168]|uniref:hypothetical protein n=1 Tax=Rhodococcus sp. 1168 TaxID=2018041 RepID=UPI00111BEE32|nr:hypothetical protein [Rhodococcus sp. 1168]